MLETGEPKDGDFARYVERLVHPPTGSKPPAAGAPPQPAAMPSAARPVAAVRPGAQAAGQQGAAANRSTPAEALAAARRGLDTVRRSAANLLAKAAVAATFAGVALLVISFADGPPALADPRLGIGLLIAGLVARRLSGKLR